MPQQAAAPTGAAAAARPKVQYDDRWVLVQCFLVEGTPTSGVRASECYSLHQCLAALAQEAKATGTGAAIKATMGDTASDWKNKDAPSDAKITRR